jgi:hypothetical protein
MRLVYLSFFLLALSFLFLLFHFNFFFCGIESIGTFDGGVGSKLIMICLLFAKWIENGVKSHGVFLLVV